MKTIGKNEALRYSRQILLSGFDLDKQELLMNASTLIVGAGGLGCAAAQYLVAAGIGDVTIVDNDTVELTNLQRQILHFEQDIGRNKAASACDTLTQLNSQTTINALDLRLDATNIEAIIYSKDIVLDCSDNLSTRQLINQHCLRSSVPLVSGAAIRMEGQVFCMKPDAQSACYGCVSQYYSEQTLTCVEAGVMSPVVGIVGAYQALEAIKILCGFGEPAINKLQLFDGMHCVWETIEITRSSSCHYCKG